MDLLVTPPILLKWRKSLVHNPIDNKTHPMGKRLRLMACHLSKNVSKRTGFLQTLSKFSFRSGESPPINNINFCQERGLNSSSACLKTILDFLILLFKEELSCSSINSAKSALFTFVTIKMLILLVRVLKYIYL